MMTTKEPMLNREFTNPKAAEADVDVRTGMEGRGGCSASGQDCFTSPCCCGEKSLFDMTKWRKKVEKKVTWTKL